MIATSDKVRASIAKSYAALDSSKQISTLATLGDRLTLLARDTYDSAGGVADSARLRNFNEAQNRVLGQIVRVLTPTDQRYPDDVFTNIVIDQLDSLGLSADLWLNMMLSA